jgi:2-dehydropantoate 2-reductase
VGCYYGGVLGRAGHEVTLIGRPRHVEAVQRSGLLLETKQFQARVAMRASTRADAVRGAQLVLFCVKSTDTETAGADMAPHLDAGALVLSLQNGVDNAERLQSLLRGELVVAPDVATPELIAVFAAAGVPLQASKNVAGALWAKLIVNCAYNAMSAITQLPYGRLVQGQGVEAVMRDVVQECLAVARAAGVAVPGEAQEAVRNIARTMPTQYSSTAQDLASGKRTEIDHLNGFVLRQGEALGVATPVNRALHALVKAIEKRQSEA